MRTLSRFLNAGALVAMAGMTLAAQPVVPRGPAGGRGPVAQGRLGPIGQERLAERRLWTQEQRAERRLWAQERMAERRLLAQGRRMGMGRGGMGMRGGGPGLRGGGPGLRGGGLRIRGGAGAVGRGPMAGRMIRDRMVARRAVIGERVRNLTPEQRTALQKHQEAARTQRQGVTERLRSGALTREQARAEMQKWREANKPPVDLRRPQDESQRQD